jgi:GTPase KRas protein
MRDGYYRHGEGFLLVYSVTTRSSFEEIVKLRDQIVRVKEDVPKVPLVLVGNKCDLEDRRQVTKTEGEDLARSWGVPFFEASAKLRINVENCFYQLVREIRYVRNPKQTKSGEAGKKKGGCMLL